MGAHRDAGVLTLLLDRAGCPRAAGAALAGVVIQDDHLGCDGGWVEVPPMPGAIIVNIGELLEVATGG